MRILQCFFAMVAFAACANYTVTNSWRIVFWGLLLSSSLSSPVSLLDITPTILDWLQLPLPSYSIFRSAVIGQR